MSVKRWLDEVVVGFKAPRFKCVVLASLVSPVVAVRLGYKVVNVGVVTSLCPYCAIFVFDLKGLSIECCQPEVIFVCA